MSDQLSEKVRKPQKEPGSLRRMLLWSGWRIYDVVADTREAIRKTYWSYRDHHYVRNWPQLLSRRIVGISLIFLGFVFVFWMTWGIYELTDTNANNTRGYEKGCLGHPLSCSGLASGLTTLLLIAFTSALFFLAAYWPAKRNYLKTIRNNPHLVVSTVGRIFGEVVGRDALCKTILKDVTANEMPRPQLIMGGVGTGKTAVLLNLTEMLAKEGYVPVPIRLREKQEREQKDKETLDFERLGEQRFNEIIKTRSRILPFTVDAGKLWQKLRNNGRVVVLADGLEELLITDDSGSGRDVLIRDAVQRANLQNLPLVIASRPHDPIRGINASVIDLEPLNEEEALRYLSGSFDHSAEDEQRLSYVVRVARVVESPIYLQIMKELCEHGLTEHLRSEGVGGVELDTRHGALTNLRLHLLDS